MTIWKWLCIVLSLLVVIIASGAYYYHDRDSMLIEYLENQSQEQFKLSVIQEIQDTLIKDLATVTDLLHSEKSELEEEVLGLQQTNQELTARLNKTEVLLGKVCDELTIEKNKEAEVKVVEIPVVTEIPQELEDWESLDELTSFLAEHEAEVPVIGIAGKDGIVQLNNFLCLGWAMGWRDYAAQQGKNLEITALTPEEYEYWFGRDVDYNHIILLAVVGKYNVYYIEPQTLEVIHMGFVP